MLRHATVLFAAFAIILAAAPDAGAQDAGDPVIVTVTGAIDNTNRGRFNAETDVFFNFHDLDFENAHAFTRSDLAALGMHEITLAYEEEWTGERTFRGPAVADVLAAAGATGDTVTLRALDGYGLELDRAMLEGGNFILALESDGEALGIGGFGPSWLVYPREDWTHETIAANSGLIWSVFHIDVE